MTRTAYTSYAKKATVKVESTGVKDGYGAIIWRGVDDGKYYSLENSGRHLSRQVTWVAVKLSDEWVKRYIK